MNSQEKMVLPRRQEVKVVDWHQEADRLTDNLRRMGCYIILYSYEELKRWMRPVDDYSPVQLKRLSKQKEEDPLIEVKAFFFEPNGVDAVIEAFDVRLDVEQVRRVAAEMVKQAETFMSGKPGRREPAPASWELLASALLQNEVATTAS